MTTGQPSDSGSTKVEQVLESRQGQFDLSKPPSRAEAGMPAGATTVTYQREDHEPFQVRVLLPEGGQLDVSTRLLAFDALSSADPAKQPPTTMDIHSYPASLEAGRDQFLAAAKKFGFDTALIEKWYMEAAAGKRPNAAPPTASSPWLRTQIGYLSLEAQARYSPAIGNDPKSDQTVLQFMLSWK